MHKRLNPDERDARLRSFSGKLLAILGLKLFSVFSVFLEAVGDPEEATAPKRPNDFVVEADMSLTWVVSQDL